ncbi:hypothetical protein [Desulfovibrio inopinatus]|uniref:hypothetical protein n=1 Tax=Desulfovibrio inopinatus TaxID=102109 RepID=UPI0003FF8BCD|nr:hypothetical protein [Desulfovibrio inopinatus]
MIFEIDDDRLNQLALMNPQDANEEFKRTLKDTGGLTGFCNDHDLSWSQLSHKLDRNKKTARLHFDDVVAIVRAGNPTYIDYLVSQLPDPNEFLTPQGLPEMRSHINALLQFLAHFSAEVSALDQDGKGIDALNAQHLYEDAFALYRRITAVMAGLRPHFQSQDREILAQRGDEA